MTTSPARTTDVLRTEYQRSVAAYWNTNQQDPVNLRLGEIDGLGPEPSWAHVPLVLGPDGERLGKRHGSVAIAHNGWYRLRVRMTAVANAVRQSSRPGVGRSTSRTADQTQPTRSVAVASS